MELQNLSGWLHLWIRGVGTATVALAATLAFHSSVHAQVTFASADGNDAEVTYAADVAALLHNNCTGCHRPGGIGPIDLVDYEDARRYARRIRRQVVNRVMPPYYYDNDIGIQELKHDWRLSDEDINTIVEWVDQGTPLGDPADIPELNLLDTEDWSLADMYGQPDLIAASSPIDVPATGLDLWHRPFVPTGNTEDRCIKALQVKPRGTAKSVVHHANTTFELRQEDGSFKASGDRASEYAMGKLGEIIPEGVCRVIPKDAYVRWDIHMFPGGLGASAPNDVIEDNVVELGIWLQPEDYEYEYKQDLALYQLAQGELLIPPHATIMTQGFRSFDHPVRIDSFQPHGHLRLRAASLEIFYPQTGRTEVISMISDWSATWHQSHLYEDDVAPLVPAGAVLVMKQWYDNTAENPNNPDADQWVQYGSRTADEMTHAWIAVTHLDQEGFDKLTGERKEKAKVIS